MKIEIFEPAMCCPSGVCGPSVDSKLVKLQETLRLIQERSGGRVEVERFNLSSSPNAFVENAAVGEMLREMGPKALPLVFIDGELIAKQGYPSAAEFQQAIADHGIEINLGVSAPAKKCCGPGCC